MTIKKVIVERVFQNDSYDTPFNNKLEIEAICVASQEFLLKVKHFYGERN